MFGGSNAAVDQAPPAPPRLVRSLWCRLLVWAGCISLAVCGVLTFILAIWNTNRTLSHFFLAVYFVIFGVVATFSELRFAFALRCFGFLSTKFGLGIFFIFAGTLGLSFWVGKSAAVLVPFICGIVWCIIGVMVITDSAIKKNPVVLDNVQ